MRRITALLLVLVLALGLVGCGKSQAVKDAEAAINEIGEVSLDSKEAIEKAEKLSSILTDTEKGQLSNRLVLVEAREAFDKLQKEVIYNNAEEAYKALNDVATLCINGMDDIYGAWYFGIYKASDVSRSYGNTYAELAKQTPHFNKSQLEEAGRTLGQMYGLGQTEEKAQSAIELVLRADWQYSVQLIEVALTLRGDYDTIEEKMTEAQGILQELTDTYGDYEYYPKLKDYYAKVSSYVEFFKSPTGSFQQLKDTINDYENNIRTYQTDVGFLFK